MGVAGLGAANDNMMMLMQVLMKGMQESTDLSKNMIAVGVENKIIGDKMALAQQIIDVYA